MPEENQNPSPTLEEGAAPAAEPQEPENEAASLVELQKLLEDAGINSPKKLAGTLETSSQYGHVSRLLKEERDRNMELQRQLAETQSSRPARPATDFDLDNVNSGETIDLARMIEQGTRKAVRNEWTNIQKEQQENQQRALQQYGKIRQDNLYGKIGPMFEDKMKDPTFAYEIQMGIRDPIDEYRNLKDEFYGNVLKQAHNTISKLQGGGQKAGDTQAPHLETGERTGNIVSTEKDRSEREKILEKAKAKIKDRGTLDDYDELAVIDSIFPDAL